MIDPKAVRAFLNKERPDYTWVKQLSKPMLLDALREISPRPVVTDLMKHQLAGLLIGIANPCFGFWMGMGVGKTLMILRLLQFWHDAGRLQKGVVLVPSQEAVVSWEDEARDWDFPLPVLGLVEGSSKDKAERWRELDEGIIVTPYPSLCWMVSGLEPKLDRNKKPTGVDKLAPNRKMVDALCRGLGGMVMDESTEAKNSAAFTFRIGRGFSKRTGIRYALAGRPFGRDPIDLWAQHFLIDHGASLGPNKELFREAFFDKKKKYWGGPYSYDYTFRSDMTEDLQRCAGQSSIQYKTEECVELPPLTAVTKKFRLSDATNEYYDRVVRHLISAQGNQEVIKLDFLRLRQLSSGFLGVASDEFGAKAEIVFDNNPKLDLALEIVRGAPEDSKIVIFCEFVFSGSEISRRLRAEKIPHVWIWGQAENRPALQRRFKEDPRCRVLVLNHKIGSYALNLQVANYVVYYESPVGCIDRDQSEKRVRRKGQSKRVFQYDLVMLGGVDERIREFHRTGDNLFAAVTRDTKLLLRRS